jgi:hypothetical protein
LVLDASYRSQLGVCCCANSNHSMRRRDRGFKNRSRKTERAESMGEEKDSSGKDPCYFTVCPP